MSHGEEAADDPTILDSDPLLRRVPPIHVVPDSEGGFRPSSAAFEDHEDGSPMSVVLGKDVVAAGRREESVLQGLPGFSLVKLTAGVARSCSQIVYRAPELEEPAHAEVKGPKPRSVRKKMVEHSVWVSLNRPVP